jgi:hypothetical protein
VPFGNWQRFKILSFPCPRANKGLRASTAEENRRKTVNSVWGVDGVLIFYYIMFVVNNNLSVSGFFGALNPNPKNVI